MKFSHGLKHTAPAEDGNTGYAADVAHTAIQSRYFTRPQIVNVEIGYGQFQLRAVSSGRLLDLGV